MNGEGRRPTSEKMIFFFNRFIHRAIRDNLRSTIQGFGNEFQISLGSLQMTVFTIYLDTRRVVAKDENEKTRKQIDSV